MLGLQALEASQRRKKYIQIAPMRSITSAYFASLQVFYKLYCNLPIDLRTCVGRRASKCSYTSAATTSHGKTLIAATSLCARSRRPTQSFSERLTRTRRSLTLVGNLVGGRGVNVDLNLTIRHRCHRRAAQGRRRHARHSARATHRHAVAGRAAHSNHWHVGDRAQCRSTWQVDRCSIVRQR